MKRSKCFFLFLGILSICCCIPASVFAQKKSNQLLKKLDSSYYYPQKNGLTGLVATVVWEKGAHGSAAFKKNPQVKFSWNSVSDKRAFRVIGESLKISKEEQNGLLRFFSNYKESLLPQTLIQKFSRYPSRIARSKFGTRIDFDIIDFQDGMSRYSLFINDKLRNVSRILIDRIEAPTKVAGAFKYIEKNGHWLVSESVARFNFGGQSHIEKTLYYYRQIENIWLVSRIDQKLTKEDKQISRYIFRIKDYLLNWSNN